MHRVKHASLSLAVLVLAFGCTTEQSHVERPRSYARVAEPTEVAQTLRPQQATQAEQQSSHEEVVNAPGQPVVAGSSGRITVTISIRPELQPDGRAVVCGETNLPPGTQLMISLQEKGVPRLYQSKCSVVDGGRFRSESLGRKDGLSKGAYVADVVMPYARLQPPDVRQAIGEQGEKLTGPLVVRNALGVAVQFSTEVAIGESSAVAVEGRSVPTLLKSMPEDPATDVTYSIIKSDILPGIKRSLDVRLSRKVSETALRGIALKLKAQDPRRYEHTFICYYLPGMAVGTGAWATTHFDPNLEVRILGLTIEQEGMLTRKTDGSSQEVIGRWLDEGILKRRITFFKKGGRIFMERLWKDGSSGTDEIVEKSSGKGRMFQAAKGGGGAGEFYLIDNQGNLQLWDREGLVWTARKID